MKVIFKYQQRAVMLCEGSLEVPAEVAVQGSDAIKEWCADHETESKDLDWTLVDWEDRVPRSFEVEEI
jgi:hypothetical protein